MSQDQLKEMEEQRLLVDSADSSTASQDDERAERTHALQDIVGRTLGGQYEVLELIGFGGVGAVYKAKDVVLDRYVAIKIIHQRLTPERLMRFQREGQLLGKVIHPCIGAVHGLGTSEDGMPYMILEYVDGELLSDVLEKNSPMNPAWVMRIFTMLCVALRGVHDKGVVHRDLKPQNIIISPGDQGYDHPKIIDFGIARHSQHEQQLTQQGALIGSPQYMSPEQCLGKELDSRSDIYSMGCILYEMLVGKAPFEGDSSLELIRKHTQEAPPRLPKQYARFQKPLDKAMAKEPSERYQTIRDFADEVDKAFYFAPRRLFLTHPVQFATLAKSRKPLAKAEHPMIIFWSLLLAILLLSTAAISFCSTNPALRPILLPLVILCAVAWLIFMFTGFTKPIKDLEET